MINNNIFTGYDAKQLNRLFEKISAGEKLTKKELEHKEFLLNKWEEEQEKINYKSWIASQI